MNSIETATFLTTAKLTDGRLRLDEELARVDRWEELLGDTTFPEAMRALDRHQKETTVVPLPRHILALVEVERERVLEPGRIARQTLELEAYRNPPQLTDADKAEAERVFQESLAAARALKGGHATAEPVT